MLIPHDDQNNALTLEKRGPLFDALDTERMRVGIEICYCSTLGDCWTLRSGAAGNSTTETRTCPEASGTIFEQ